MSKGGSGGRGGIGAKASSPSSDFERLSRAMKKANPRSERGAPVLISDLRRELPSWKGDDFDAKLVRLDRARKVQLIRFDPALSVPMPRSSLVSDGRFLYSGVAFTNVR